MDEVDIEVQSDRLYKYVPKSIIPVIVVTVFILGILIMDIATGSSTNLIIFYGLPILYLLTFMTLENIPIIVKVVGWHMPDLKSKIVALISIPLGFFFGALLVRVSQANASVLPIATFPFASASFATAGTTLLSSLGDPSLSFFFFAIVAFSEEAIALYMGKNIANYLHSKGVKNTILVVLVSLLLGRIVLVFHHWIAYGGWSQPYLYLSALMLFTVFTILGIFTGLFARGYIKDLSSVKIIPVFAPIMFSIHLGFDFFLSRLMVIP